MLAVPSNDLYLRARMLFDAAERLAEVPAEQRRAATLAQADLYRQATFWGLVALAPPQAPRDWQSLLVGAPEFSETTRAMLTAAGTGDDAIDAASLGSMASDLRAAARSVLDAAEAPARAMAAVRHRFVVRRLLQVIALLVAIPVAVATGARMLEAEDLAKGKPWRASSKLADCHPEQIECGGVRTPIFFHTLQENEPWVEIDLQQPTQFSAVTIYNRSDGWGDRAVPLQLEVGDDQKTWRPLGRRDDQFKVWWAKFPTTTARYVRLRATRNTLLHLDGVRVYR